MICFKQNFNGIENNLVFNLGMFAKPGDMNPFPLNWLQAKGQTLSLPGTE